MNDFEKNQYAALLIKNDCLQAKLDAVIMDLNLAAAEGGWLGACIACAYVGGIESGDKSSECWNCTNGKCKFKWRGTKHD